MSQAAHEISKLSHFVAGEDVGISSWIPVDQTMISDFGRVTLDPDPMHIDPDWARANGPYGGTIAFGFLTLSLLTHMLHDTMGTDPQRADGKNGHFLNYGMDYLRLLSPVKVGSRVRGRFKVAETRTDTKGRDIVKFGCEVEIEGSDRPALVAEWLSIWMPNDDA